MTTHYPRTDPTHHSGQCSRTALTTAAARAAHLIVDGTPRIHADPIAETLLGPYAETLVAYHRLHGDNSVLSGARAQTVCRSRYAEDRVAEAARAGIRQYVILGAGLDTFAYRAPADTPIRVFEVDEPATQEWKRRRLDEAGTHVPETVRYVPVDLERDHLVRRLAEAGFDRDRPAVVSWLGVTMYLTRPAITRTLAELARLAPGTEIIVDYLLPEEERDEAGSEYAIRVGVAAAEMGEPWLTFMTPEAMTELLAARGLEVVEQVAHRDMIDPVLWKRNDSLRPARLLQIAHAKVSSPDGARHHRS